MNYITEIETRISGIPCLIGVTEWEAYRSGYTSGPADRCYDAEGGCGSWEVLDRRGRPAPWLERKLTEKEESRIEQEVFDAMENMRRYR